MGPSSCACLGSLASRSNKSSSCRPRPSRPARCPRRLIPSERAMRVHVPQRAIVERPAMRHGCTLRWSVTAEPRESDPLQSAKQIRSLPPTGDCAGLSSIRTAVCCKPGDDHGAVRFAAWILWRLTLRTTRPPVTVAPNASPLERAPLDTARFTDLVLVRWRSQMHAIRVRFQRQHR